MEGDNENQLIPETAEQSLSQDNVIEQNLESQAEDAERENRSVQSEGGIPDASVVHNDESQHTLEQDAQNIDTSQDQNNEGNGGSLSANLLPPPSAYYFQLDHGQSHPRRQNGSSLHPSSLSQEEEILSDVDGGGLSDATTAIASDSEGHWQAYVTSQTGYQSASLAAATKTSSSSSGTGNLPGLVQESTDVGSIVTISTLSSLTSNSSGFNSSEEKRNDISFKNHPPQNPFEDSRFAVCSQIIASPESCIIDQYDDSVVETTGKLLASTPAEESFGSPLSQPMLLLEDFEDEEGDDVIPPSPDAFISSPTRLIPFSIPPEIKSEAIKDITDDCDIISKVTTIEEKAETVIPEMPKPELKKTPVVNEDISTNFQLMEKQSPKDVEHSPACQNAPSIPAASSLTARRHISFESESSSTCTSQESESTSKNHSKDRLASKMPPLPPKILEKLSLMTTSTADPCEDSIVPLQLPELPLGASADNPACSNKSVFIKHEENKLLLTDRQDQDICLSSKDSSPILLLHSESMLSDSPNRSCERKDQDTSMFVPESQEFLQMKDSSGLSEGNNQTICTKSPTLNLHLTESFSNYASPAINDPEESLLIEEPSSCLMQVNFANVDSIRETCDSIALESDFDSSKIECIQPIVEQEINDPHLKTSEDKNQSEEDPFALLRQPDLSFQELMLGLPGPSGLGRTFATHDSDSDSDSVEAKKYREPKMSVQELIKSHDVMKWTDQSSQSTSIRGKGRGKRSKPKVTFERANIPPSQHVDEPSKETCDQIIYGSPLKENDTPKIKYSEGTEICARSSQNSADKKDMETRNSVELLSGVIDKNSAILEQSDMATEKDIDNIDENSGAKNSSSPVQKSLEEETAAMQGMNNSTKDEGLIDEGEPKDEQYSSQTKNDEKSLMIEQARLAVLQPDRADGSVVEGVAGNGSKINDEEDQAYLTISQDMLVNAPKVSEKQFSKNYSLSDMNSPVSHVPQRTSTPKPRMSEVQEETSDSQEKDSTLLLDSGTSDGTADLTLSENSKCNKQKRIRTTTTIRRTIVKEVILDGVVIERIMEEYDDDPIIEEKIVDLNAGLELATQFIKPSLCRSSSSSSRSLTFPSKGSSGSCADVSSSVSGHTPIYSSFSCASSASAESVNTASNKMTSSNSRPLLSANDCQKNSSDSTNSNGNKTVLRKRPILKEARFTGKRFKGVAAVEMSGGFHSESDPQLSVEANSPEETTTNDHAHTYQASKLTEKESDNKKSKRRYFPSLSDENGTTVTETTTPEKDFYVKHLADFLVNTSVEQHHKLLRSIPVTEDESIQKLIDSGIRVFAKWCDGNYYSGKINSKEKLGRWNVLFDDGSCRSTNENEIFVIGSLPIGSSVYAKLDDDYFDSGIIVKTVTKNKATEYIVETDSGICKSIQLSFIMMTLDQITCLVGDEKSTCNVSLSNVGLHNIVDAKLRENSSPHSKSKYCTRASSTSSKGEEPLEFASRKALYEKSKMMKLDVKSPLKISSPSRKRTRNSQSDTDDPSMQSTKKRGLNKSPEPASLQQGECSHTITKEIFKGKKFWLTQGEKIIANVTKNSTSDSLSLSDESGSLSELKALSIPFCKTSLQSKITKEGGVVLHWDSLSQTRCSEDCYLIANSYARTKKFFYCLAVGIPCISHLWIIDSCQANQLLSIGAYLLPSGISILNKKLIEWHNKRSVLSKIPIMLVSSEDKKFLSVWSSIVEAAGAIVISRLPTGSNELPGVVVTDASCPPSIARRSKKLGIPLVSTEWLIQCLIHGRQLPFNAHSEFASPNK